MIPILKFLAVILHDNFLRIIHEGQKHELYYIHFLMYFDLFMNQI